MSKIQVTIKAVFLLPPRPGVPVLITITDGNNRPVVNNAEISSSGKTIALEAGSYRITAFTRDRTQNVRTRVDISNNRRVIKLNIPPRGEDCRKWLEIIKQMIADHDYQNAKNEILLAKGAYEGIVDTLSEEDSKTFKEILDLEKTLPDTPARIPFVKRLFRFFGFR